MFFLKLFLSVAILLGAAETAKRSPFFGALIIALPITSMLSMVWLYWDTQDSARVSEFARDIFYLVPPSLLFFVPFVFSSRTHLSFWQNFIIGTLFMVVAMLLIKFLIK
ncbi:hypothetical protein EDC63_1271 [Sulfurirhabdus autotrophica]|uniref:DUF3147 family protein n=1 Tax=Sulfurirhabdus autotrophica TaxID=1706046 RepID=A0A4R3XST6_9PROT|nr:hypothetical protein EDC63_1271 [Sulfurirhabdus autotrophica]